MKNNITRTLVMLALIVLLCSWGEKGHQKINGSAPRFFPARLNHFKGWSEKLSEHGQPTGYNRSVFSNEGLLLSLKNSQPCIKIPSCS